MGYSGSRIKKAPDPGSATLTATSIFFKIVPTPKVPYSSDNNNS